MILKKTCSTYELSSTYLMELLINEIKQGKKVIFSSRKELKLRTLGYYFLKQVYVGWQS
jgi:hypothetical protein